MTARLVVMASGRGTNLQALMDAAGPGGRLHGVAEVVAVVSHTPTALALERARRHGIAAEFVAPPPKAAKGGGRAAWDAALAERVAAYEPDVVVLAGSMRIVGPGFIDRFPDERTAGRRAPTARSLNLHPALPGELPGTDAIERAFEEAVEGRRKESGVMVHVVVAEVDAGPVVAVERVPMPEGAAFEAFEAAMRAAEHRVMVEGVLRFLEAPPVEEAP